MILPEVFLVVSMLKIGSNGKPQEWGIKWDMDIRYAEPPLINTQGVYGISMLGGQYTFAYSPIVENQWEWTEQIQISDILFERVLADMLITAIIKAQETVTYKKTNSKKKKNKTVNKTNLAEESKLCKDDAANIILVKGPTFPKLLGRLAYQQMNE
jgi:hypothetical protein